MKNLATTAALLASTASAAFAGGIERTDQSVLFMFEEGKHAELSIGVVNPTVSGHISAAPSVVSGDMAKTYTQGAFSYKQQFGDNLHLGVKIDRPYGASVEYPLAAGYPYAGSTADLSVNALTAVARYELESNISLLGGIRVQQARGEVGIPALGGYTMTTSKETDTGYLLGVAWERPDIAARVALTYNSEITHAFSTVEMGALPGSFDTTTPQSVNLEFQTGIAADTLLFGSVRWVDWTKFNISPSLVPNLVDYDDDTISYSLGIGRKFTETWSGALTLGYEAGTGGYSGNLGPTDGSTSIGLAAIYSQDAMKVTFGVRYVKIGDANTDLDPGAGVTESTFSGNSAIAAGIRIGYSF